jgi:hypothetical protein
MESILAGLRRKEITVLKERAEAPPGCLAGRLTVAQRNCERIRRIRGLRQFLEREQRAHHLLNLRLIRVAIASDGGLHFARRITMYGQSSLGCGEENHAAHFREAQSRFYIERGEDGFKRNRIG